jgi:hypothetical protein
MWPLISSSHVQLCDLSYLGKICRSTYLLGDDANYNKLDYTIHIFTICYKIQLSTLNGPSRASNRRHPTLPGRERQPRICPLSPTSDVLTTTPQPSSPSTCPTALNKRMATPFKGQLGSTKLYYNHHIYTKRATRDGCHTWRVRICFDDRLPVIFNHNIAGAAKQLS